MTNDMTDINRPNTGPEYAHSVDTSLDEGSNHPTGSVERVEITQEGMLNAMMAQTAAIVMLTEVIANATGTDHYDLDAWREAIPASPLKECRGKEARRPACKEWHTEDCSFSDPKLPEGTRVGRRKHKPGQPHGTVNEQRRLPDGKYRLRVQWDGAEEAWIYQDEIEIIRHEKLPIGTRVMVNDQMTKYDYKVEYDGHPWVGKITGYASNGCYLIAQEWGMGSYSDNPSFIYMDERVRVHPDGPECPPPPEPVKSEPTGPRVYVENSRGKQGYVIEVLHIEKDDSLWYRVQFLVPGVEPVLKRADSLTVIAASQVTRCENGQTRQECTEIDPCEPCQQDADEEGDKIEESMGLR